MKTAALPLLSLLGPVLLLAAPAAPLVRDEPAGEPAVRVRVLPAVPYIEVSESNQYLNFDFHIENLTEQVLRLRRIHLTVADDRGSPVLRRVLDERGMSPSIDTAPIRVLEPKGVLFLFNPFYFFGRELTLASLRYEFRFSTSDGSLLPPVTVTVHPVRYEGRTDLVIPLHGRVLVEDGHDFYAHHRRIDLSHPVTGLLGLETNPTRFALDLTLCDAEGLPHAGRGDRLEDWYGYGAMVYAPGDGTVVRLRDGIPENTLEDGRVIHSEAVSLEKPETLLGNFLVVDHGTGEFSLLAHLQAGSFRVKEGEAVRQGQALAAVGFSGDTWTVVHLHYQLQTGSGFFTAEALPIYFRDFRRLLGSHSMVVHRGLIDTGDVVEPLQPPSK